VADRTEGHGTDPSELSSVLAAASAPVTAGQLEAELIFADPAASATAGIWRFGAGDWSIILKVLRHGDRGSPMWQSGEDELHWYYWKREALAYQSALLDAFSEGLRPPKCFAVFERPDGSISVWMEDLRRCSPAADWTIRRYESAAEALGRAQGCSHATYAASGTRWIGRNWLRRYVERRQSFLQVIGKPAWQHPLVRANLPPDTAERAAAIWERREDLLSLVEASPLCLCHDDLHPGNLFAQGPTTVLIDWAFLAIGHAGEDPGNLIFDAVLDFFVPPDKLDALEQAVTDGYLRGLSDTLHDVDPSLVRRAIWATGAVKYFWIPLSMVDAIDQDRMMLNRRPLDETFHIWAQVVPKIFDVADRFTTGAG
jgi:aminoglycoside phosphotransferase (APT) family kinase protein